MSAESVSGVQTYTLDNIFQDEHSYLVLTTLSTTGFSIGAFRLRSGGVAFAGTVRPADYINFDSANSLAGGSAIYPAGEQTNSISSTMLFGIEFEKRAGLVGCTRPWVDSSFGPRGGVGYATMPGGFAADGFQIGMSVNTTFSVRVYERPLG